MTIPIPPWVSTLGSLSPLILGIAGILVGRKTKAATDDIRYNDLHSRVKDLEETQSEHVITLTTIQNTLEFFQERFDHVEQVGDINSGMLMEVRGMLYAMQGQVPPALPMPQFRRRMP